MPRKLFLISIFLLPFSFLLSGCCFNCLISRSELSGQKDLEQQNHRATEIWAGNIDSVITSEYGGNLQSFTVDEVSPMIKLPGYYNSDLLLSCDSGRLIDVQDVQLYDSERKAVVKMASTLTESGFKMEKGYRMNLDTGDIYISKIIINETPSLKNIEALQQIVLCKGGFLLVPVNVSSEYPDGYEFKGLDAKTQAHVDSPRVDRIANKIVCQVTDNLSGLILNTDSTEGWFGYFYKDTLLLVRYSPFYTSLEKKKAIVFQAEMTKDAIICAFGQTFRNLPEKNSSIKIYEKIALIKLKSEINSIEDINKALKYLKVNLIVRR